MARVKVRVFELEVVLEDNESSFNILLDTAINRMSILMKEENVKESLNKFFENDDDTDEIERRPPKNDDKGMFQ